MATTSTSPQIDNRNKDLTGRVGQIWGVNGGIDMYADRTVVMLTHRSSSA